jgi:hypothetical protein
MAKDKPKDRPTQPGSTRDDPAAARGSGQHGTAGTLGAADAAGGQHHAARAHGKPARVDESLPSSRADLLALHAQARGKRNTASLGSPAFKAAVEEIARIEVRIAAVDRAADPPLG